MKISISYKKSEPKAMKIWAWGANSNGQCGLGFNSEQVESPTEVPIRFQCPQKPNKTKSFKDYKDVLPIKIAGSATDTVVLIENTPFTEPFEWKPNFHILPYPDVQDIASGWDFNLYLSKNGTLFSRGSNTHCQLGRVLEDGSNHSNVWNSNIGTADVSDESRGRDLCLVAAGLRHGVVISKNLELLVWGSNSHNQIGPLTDLGRMDVRPFGKQVKSPQRASILDYAAGFPTGFTQVACGKDFTVVCDAEGWLYGCGHNKFGTMCHAPQDVKSFQGFATMFEKLPNMCFPGNIADLKCGWGHVLALLDTGKVVTWGRNDLGQLGRDSYNPKFDVEPQVVPLPEKISSIACGSEHSLALSISGAVYAWGWNEHLNCGVPNSAGSDCIRRPIRVPIPGYPRVEVVGCGPGTSFAISS